jgi:hypothetical protein
MSAVFFWLDGGKESTCKCRINEESEFINNCKFRRQNRVDIRQLDHESFMKEAIIEAERGFTFGQRPIVDSFDYVKKRVHSYIGGILKDECEALIEKYSPEEAQLVFKKNII